MAVLEKRTILLAARFAPAAGTLQNGPTEQEQTDMKVIVLGATGMVGAGSLREALQSVTQGRADGFVLESADINRVGA